MIAPPLVRGPHRTAFHDPKAAAQRAAGLNAIYAPAVATRRFHFPIHARNEVPECIEPGLSRQQRRPSLSEVSAPIGQTGGREVLALPSKKGSESAGKNCYDGQHQSRRFWHTDLICDGDPIRLPKLIPPDSVTQVFRRGERVSRTLRRVTSQSPQTDIQISRLRSGRGCPVANAASNVSQCEVAAPSLRYSNSVIGISVAAGFGKGGIVSDQPRDTDEPNKLESDVLVPPYPAWVKEVLERRIDAAVDRHKRAGDSRKPDCDRPVKPKPP